MTTPKKKSKKKSKKESKLDGEALRMAQLYEKAWHELYYKRPRFAQEEIINEPQGRRAKELAHEVAKLAEAWMYEEEHGSFNDGPNEWKD